MSCFFALFLFFGCRQYYILFRLFLLLLYYILFRARALLPASGPVANPESAPAPGGLAGAGGGGGGGQGAEPPAGWRVDVLGAASSSAQSPSPIVWLNDIEVRQAGRQAGRRKAYISI